MPKIGDVLFLFDINRRVYREPGRVGGGGPIYAEHFRPLQIVGETKQSWLLQNDYKASKKDLANPDLRPRKYFTTDQRADDIWVNDHGHRIVALLKSATAAQLRQVAAIVGYKPDPAAE